MWKHQKLLVHSDFYEFMILQSSLIDSKFNEPVPNSSNPRKVKISYTHRWCAMYLFHYILQLSTHR